MAINPLQEVPVKSFSISAYICQKDDSGGRFLLIRRTSRYLHGTWQQVSGLVEPGEKAWEAALREIEEETSLVPDAFYSADLIECFYEVEQNTINLVPVFVGFVDADARVRLSHEHSDYMWFASTETNDYLHFSSQRESVAHIQRTFLDNEPSELLRINFSA